MRQRNQELFRNRFLVVTAPDSMPCVFSFVTPFSPVTVLLAPHEAHALGVALIGATSPLESGWFVKVP